MATPPAVQDPPDEITNIDPLSGAVINAPPTEEKPLPKVTTKIFRTGEHPPPSSAEREAMLERPYVAPTGGEPTPVQYESGAPPQEPGPLGYELPGWPEVTATDTYKQADSDTKLKMLEDWTADARVEGRQAAIKNNEDPDVYEKGIDNIYAQNRKKLENPYTIASQSGKAFTRGALVESEKIAAGLVTPLTPLVKLDDIKNLSLDEAKHEAEVLSEQQPAQEERANAAKAYLKNPLATGKDLLNAQQNLLSLEDQDKYYHNVSQEQLEAARAKIADLKSQTMVFPGGTGQAIDAVKVFEGNNIRLGALNRYVGSKGTDLPKESDLQRAAELVKQFPEMTENAMKSDQVYLKEHPKFNQFSQAIGAMVPYIAAGTMTEGIGALGVDAAETVMTSADAFQTGYEGAQERLNERERNGEYFSPAERETLALNDASESAFGVGSFQSVSNIILGHAFHGFHLDPEARILAGENLKRMLLHAGKETGAQIGIQAGSQILSNVAAAKSEVAPETPWYAGVPEAVGEGALYGGVGSGIRLMSSATARHGATVRLDGLADQVRNDVQDLMQKSPDPNMTQDRAFEQVLNEKVPPADRDQVRVRILNQDAAKDQSQTADKLRDAGSPSTAAELDKAAAASASTTGVPTESRADRIARLQAEARAKIAAAEQEAAKTKPGEEKKPPTEAGAPGAKPAGEAAAPTPPTPEDTASRDERRGQIQEKVDQLLGSEASDEDKAKLVKDYLERKVYQDPNLERLQRTGAAQVLHDLGIAPARTKMPDSWKKHTPELLNMMEDHFSDFLDTRLEEKRAQEEAAAKAAAAPAVTPAVTPAIVPPVEAGAPPPPPTPEEKELAPSMVMPPGMMEEAVKTNDPTKLLAGLRAGKKQEITEDQSVEYDDFLYQHGLTLDTAPNGNYFLREINPPEKVAAEKAAAEKEAEEVAAKGVTAAKEKSAAEAKKEADILEKVSGVALSKNAPAYSEETNQLPEHPQEKELLKRASDWLFSPKGEGFIRSKVKEHEYVPEIQSAALEGYRRGLRSEVGKGVTLENAGPEATEGGVSIKNHVALAAQELGEQLSTAGRSTVREREVRLEAPLGEEGGKTQAEVTAAEAEPEAKEAAATEAEVAKGAPEAIGVPAVEGKEFAKRFNVGFDPLQKAAEEFEKTLAPKDKRIVWYILTSENHYNLPKQTEDTAGIKIPEGTKSFKGITDADARRIDALFHQWAKEHSGLTPAGAEAATHGHEPGHPAPGTAGGVAPVAERGPNAPPHAEPVLPKPEGVGAEPGGAAAATGGREPGLPQEGETAAGQPETILPGAGGAPGGGAGAAAAPGAGAGAAGGAAGAERPRGPSAASGERTAIVREKTAEERGGPNSTPGKPGVGGGAAGVTEAAAPARGATLARALLKDPEVAEDYGIDLGEHNTVPKLVEHLAELAEHEDDPDEWYQNLAEDLGLSKPAGAAAPPAPEAIQTENQNKIIEAYRALKAETGREVIPNAEVIRRAGINTADGKNAIKTLGARIQLEPGNWKEAPKAHKEAAVLAGGAPQLHMRVLEEAQPARIAEAASQTVAQKLTTHLLSNPEIAQRVGLAEVKTPDDLILAVSRMGTDMTPEKIDRILTSVAQKLGVVDPPHPPGGTQGSGTMHSLVPGLAGVHHFSGEVNDLVGRFRNSPDPELQAFAVSLNAHKDRLVGMPVRQLNSPAPAIFYHDGELWVSPAAVNHQLGEVALAHEIQHAIAQQKIGFPQTAEEFDHAAHWEHLRDQLRQSLPAELRDNLESLGSIFNRLAAGEELDPRFLTHAERNWLPVLYAAHSSENMMHAAFSNPVFRDYLKSVAMGDGRTLLEGVEHWGRTVFGSQAFQFADRAVPLVKDRPGIPVRFNPKVFDLKDSYPLTESEKHANLMAQRYRLRDGVTAMLKAVHELSTNPRHLAVAKALLKAVEAHPEIRAGLEDRLGGIAGGYDFKGDRVTVSPHLEHEDIESSILHEVTHALTLGKIDAYEKGLTHLLSASDMQAITELEEIRQQALKSKGVPDIVRRIADLPTYEQREKAWLDLGQRDPALMNKFYGLGDTREFASEVLSNGELQDHLKGVAYRGEGEKPQTMLQKMFSWVRKFLGFKEDTALGHAFEAIGTLTGGRRVMESDIRTGELESDRTMPMQENLLAKRYLENRAQTEGFREGVHQVPPEQVNAWLREFRDNRGLASGEDPYRPTTIAQPETRGMIRANPQLDAMTDPRDIIDHLARVTGTSRFDTDALRNVADQALRNKALSLEQYVATHAGLNELEHQTFNKLHFNLSPGSKEDNYSAISRFLNGMKSLWRSPFPEEMAQMIRTQSKYLPQEASLVIRQRLDDLRSAVAKTNKGGKLTPKMNEDMTRVLKGEPPPKTMPVPVINALDAMRAEIDRQSIDIAPYAGKEKQAAIVDNLGKYVARTYRFFDDIRYTKRDESKALRPQAEAEVNAWLKGKDRTVDAKRIANNAKANAERNFGPGSTAGKAAGKAAYAAAYAEAMKNVGKNFIDRKLAEWTQAIENKATGALQYGHAYNINDKLLEELTNLPEAFRQMIGEETDPGAIFARTVWRQQAYLNSVQLANGLVKLGQRSGIISDRLDLTRGLTHEIPKGFAHMGELAGKYTTRDIAAGLTNYAKGLAEIDQGPFLKLISGLEGTARYTNTIGSLARSFGNIGSMVFQHLNNGYFTFNRRAAQDIFVGQLLRMNNPAREAYLRKGYRLGLSDKESNINVIMDFMNRGPHLMSRTPLDFMESLGDWAEKAKVPGVRRVLEGVTDLHTVWNFMSKMSQFEQQKIKEKAFNDWDVKNRGAARLTDEQIENRAADIVRKTNVSYSLASPMIQRLRRTPVMGTFLTFWEQALHSFANSGIEAFKNIRSENPLRRLDGAKRLGGMMISMSLPLMLQELSKQMFGVSSKEDENFRTLLPPWEKNNAIFYGAKDGTKRTYYNALYSQQQADIYRAMHALLAPNPHGAAGKVMDAGWELFRPLLSLGLVPGAAVSVLRNQTEYGTQVYNPNDTLLNQAGDVSKLMFSRILGGTVGRLGSKIVPGLKPEGTTTPGGLVYNSWTTLAPEFGIPVKQLSFPERFNSELYSTKDSIDHAQRLFTGPVQRSGTELTDDQMSGLYQRSEDARRMVFSELHDKVSAARFGGMTTNQIKQALKSRRYSTQEIDDIMTGHYHPYIPSKGILDNARKNGNLVPNHLFSKHGVVLEEEGE